MMESAAWMEITAAMEMNARMEAAVTMEAAAVLEKPIPTKGIKVSNMVANAPYCPIGVDVY